MSSSAAPRSRCDAALHFRLDRPLKEQVRGHHYVLVTFPMVFPRFLEWISDEPYHLASWGRYDVGQFHLDCARHTIPFPGQFESCHINLKAKFAAWKGVRRCGMARALAQLGLAIEGSHHRGIDDARNIARIAQAMTPEVCLNGPFKARGSSAIAH